MNLSHPPVHLTLLTAASCAAQVQRIAPAPDLTVEALEHLRDRLMISGPELVSLNLLEVAQLHSALVITRQLVLADLIKWPDELRRHIQPEQLEAANTFLRDGLPDDLRALHPLRLSPPAQARSST